MSDESRPPGEPPSADPPAPGDGDPPLPADVPPGDGGPPRRRAGTVFGPGGWFRRFARVWGFLAFAVLVVVLARAVLLPFVFALLVAYILAPVVDRMSRRRDGRARMPRGLAILLCYIVFLAGVAVFLVVLLPRLSKDVSRIGAEAPKLYEQLNEQWAPSLARWLEARFPSLAPPPAGPEQEAPVVAEVPLPPGTALVVTPLPDGRLAVQLHPSGVEVTRTGSGFTLVPTDDPAEVMSTEDHIRAWAQNALERLESQLVELFRFGQSLVSAMVRGVFAFFLTLMVAGFILLDLGRIHAFVRSLIPGDYRPDYDVIVSGMDRGLSGVIRGQLLICLVNGVLTYIGLVIFGVKYSLILALVAAVMSIIPIFGSILSTIPIVLAALVSGDHGVDLSRALLVLVWIIGIHFVEANFLNPKIIGSAARIHPVLVIFALIVGQHGYGLVGALLAVPAASMVQVLFLFFRDKAWKIAPDRAAPEP